MSLGISKTTKAYLLGWEYTFSCYFHAKAYSPSPMGTGDAIFGVITFWTTNHLWATIARNSISPSVAPRGCVRPVSKVNGYFFFFL